MEEDRGGWCTKVGRGSMGLVYGEVSEHGGIVFGGIWLLRKAREIK